MQVRDDGVLDQGSSGRELRSGQIAGYILKQNLLRFCVLEEPLSRVSENTLDVSPYRAGQTVTFSTRG